MAKVYRAHDQSLDRTVAMKALAPNAPDLVRDYLENRIVNVLGAEDYRGLDLFLAYAREINAEETVRSEESV
jgi:hypothetical protein